MELPRRKHIRLSDYDYSTPGAYFVTICTKGRHNLFWNRQNTFDTAVGAAISRLSNETILPCCLTEIGEIVNQAIQNIPHCYSMITVDKYVIMPNHVHLILRIDWYESGLDMISAPTISMVIGQMKRWASKKAGQALWQKSYHEHVIRSENDYLEIRKYIEENPAKWAEDRYYAT